MKYLFFYGLLLTGLWGCLCAQPSVTDVLEKLDRPQVGKAWEVPFVQRRTFSFRRRDSRFEGVLILDSTGDICVRYMIPFQRSIIIAEGQKYMLDDSGEQHALPEDAVDWAYLMSSALNAQAGKANEKWQMHTDGETHTLKPVEGADELPEELEITIENDRVVEISIAKGSATHHFELDEPQILDVGTVKEYLNE